MTESRPSVPKATPTADTAKPSRATRKAAKAALQPKAPKRVPMATELPSREQVLIALGTPSTTAEFGGEVFYYISQTRARAVQFVNSRIVDQRILAVYFDRNGRVTQIADYGLQDGQIFDFLTRTTPTGGEDMSFLQQMFRGLFGG